MKKTFAAVMSGLMLSTGLVFTPAVVTPADAAIQGSPRAVVIKLNGEGFRACRRMGDTGFTALTEGELTDGSGGGVYTEGFKRFRIRSCFETIKGCERFVNRIENIVPGVYEVYLRRCTQRG